jgi:hypothetical protein
VSAHYCPDCGLFEVSVRKPGKDGRCDWCRSQIGRRRPESVSQWRGYSHDQLLARLGRTR